MTLTVKRIGSNNWAIYAAGEMVEAGFATKGDAMRAAAELGSTVGSMVSLDAALSLEAL